jgi:hypothetical protein
MPAAHEVKFEEKSGGDAVCAAALATVKAAAMPPARSRAVEANLDIVLSLVSSPTGPGRTCSRMNPGCITITARKAAGNPLKAPALAKAGRE